MNCQDIERIIRHAGHLMAESLWEYWPSEKDNDIPEINISLYLSIAFHQKGFKCFADANWKKSTNKRLDFFAINPETGITVCGEFKKLFTAEKCKSMKKDFNRIQSFIPLEHCGKYKPKFGILAATTFKPKIVTWWSTLDGPKPSSHENWNKLSKKLQNAYWGCIPLNTYDEETKLENTELHYLLYSVFEIN